MLRLLIDENLNHRILRGLRLVVPELECVVAQNAGSKPCLIPNYWPRVASKLSFSLRTT